MYNRLGEVKKQHEVSKKKDFFSATLHPRDIDWLIEQAEKAQLLEHQMNRFEYLAAYEYSWQVDNVKASNTKYRQGALEGMENYNRKWKEATDRDIKAMW